DLQSLRNAKNMIEIVRHARPNDAPPKLVLNQAGQPKRPEIPVKDFAETMGFEATAVIPYDPALFGTAANNGQMLAEVQPNAAAPGAVRLPPDLLPGRATPKDEKAAIPFLSFLKGKKRA